MKKRTYLLVIGAISGMCGITPGIGGEGGSGDGKMTLNDAIAAALARDPTIAKVYSDVDQAKGYLQETKAGHKPHIYLEGSAGAAYRDRSIDGLASGGDVLFSRKISLVARQLLWDGGYTKYRIKDANSRVLAKEHLDKAQRELTAWQTVEAYIDVIRARKQVVLSRQNLDIHSAVLQRATKRAEGAGNQADTELSTARYDLALTVLRERELALTQAEVVFMRWTGQLPRALVVPKIPSVKTLQEIDPKNNWHYQAVIKQLEAAEFEKTAIQKKRNPRLYVEGRGSLGQDVLGIEGKDNEASALVIGTWDIFDGGLIKGQTAQAAADIYRQRAILAETVVLLNQDIEARWVDYKTISSRINLVQKYLNHLVETERLYQEQFDLGTRPLLSLLDIQNEMSSARIRLADEERDHTYLGYRLLFFGGRLIPDTVGANYISTPPNSMLVMPGEQTFVPASMLSGK